MCTFLCVNTSCCVIKIHAHGVPLRTYPHKLRLGGLPKIPTQLKKRNFVERKTMAIPYILNSGPRVPPSSLGRRSIVNGIWIAAFSHMQYSLLCNSCTVYNVYHDKISASQPVYIYRPLPLNTLSLYHTVPLNPVVLLFVRSFWLRNTYLLSNTHTNLRFLLIVRFYKKFRL